MLGRILTHLKQQGRLVEPPRTGVAGSRRALRPRPYAVRKPKQYAVSRPGDLVQVDTLEVRPVPGVVFKQFTARDVVSRWDVIQAHTRATASAATQFLDTLQHRMPFPIRAQAAGSQTQSEALPKLRNLMMVGAASAGIRSFSEMLGLGDASPVCDQDEVRPDSVLVLQYTSGTTAFPKAAMLTQGQSLRNAFQMAKRTGFDEEDRVLSAMPMFHVGGSVCALLGAITVGYRLYTGSSFDAGETLRLIE